MIIEVNKYSLNPRWFVAGTKGSFGHEKLEFVFSKEWDEMSKKVTFIPFGGEEISVYYTEPMDIPYEVMVRAGTCVFGVSGYCDGVKMLSVTGELKVLDTVASPDNSRYVPTPDEMTQIFTIADNALDVAAEARYFARQADTKSAQAIESANALIEEAGALSEQAKEKYGAMCELYDSAHSEYLDALEIKEGIEDLAQGVEAIKSEVIQATEKTGEDLEATKEARDEAILAKEQTIGALESTKKELGSIFSNALVGKEKGRAILVEDGVPYAQNIELTIRGNSVQEGEAYVDSPVQISNLCEPTVTKLSRNLIASPFKSGNKRVNGVQMTPAEDGSILMNGTIGSNFSENYVFYMNDDVPAVILRKGKTYRLSCINGDNLSVRLCNEGYASVIATSATSKEKIITPDKDIPIYKILGYFLSANEGVFIENERVYPMLEILGENNEFVPYTHKSVKISTDLLGVGDCADEVIVNGETGKVTYIIRYATYVFAGDEEWTVGEQTENTVLGYTNIPYPISSEYTSPEYQLCTQLPVKDVCETDEEGVFISPVLNSDGTSRVYARLPASAPDFNSVFSSGAQIIYPTKEQVHNFTGSSWGRALLDMATDVSGAFTLDCDGEMTVEYVKDINKEIEKIYRAVISLGAAL